MLANYEEHGFKITATIVNSNKHPYHLIHYSGAMVYGWVNASDCEKI